MKVTKDMFILDVLKEYPEVKKVFVDYGLACGSCLGADSARIKEVVSSHGIDLDNLLSDLNKLVEKKEKEG
ncbi:DUF1858 domain-containing protein [Sporohalobacter salinus]|uniref:DUF1858 domain-containing protein n=1 Tax=Sporohalobacter salinus TaxID=1494606 RepID=UPI001960960C|nr:DUF1858 domain-containing protein [Sporohalobacter salinus]MBM7623323.1 hybrid cluster-associated redox disulfide protein [Sporohalobacter salinus]